ncbi:hypothetical protein F383_22996 [Gossypium arboreum]|uniref:Uncharacterized protein n=1 Tax=Gossypium arboreum TaxID=29729 RepID=A0A0B0P303_GOSAR|nr:hypothetical protein F383_22996 [Gossypium arboreum]
MSGTSASYLILC